MSFNNTVVRLYCFALGLAVILVMPSLTSAKPTRPSNTDTPPPSSGTTTTSLNLSNFGAVGNGVADDGPAFQRALDALAAAGGGTLFVPAGTYFVATPVVKDFSALSNGTITIRGVPSTKMPAPVTASGQDLAEGLDLTSQIIPATGSNQSAFIFKGVNQLTVEHIGFTGRPDILTDAFVTLYLSDIGKATIRHCEFYALSSFGILPDEGGGNIIRSVRSDLSIELSVFLGCTASSGAYGPLVQNLDWLKFSITNSIFLDYGLRAFFGKTGYGAPLSWINLGNAAQTTPESLRREFVVRDTFLDEGGWVGISAMPNRLAPSATIDLLYISGLKMNVSNMNMTGHLLYDIDNLLVENSHYGWSHNAYAALDINRIGNAILDNLTCIDHADRLYADELTRRLTVINSHYSELDSHAQTTTVFDTTPEEDPVQYVRQQFLSGLGRQPEPAAHFYWSDLLIKCGQNNDCLNGQRAALSQYLAAHPEPEFALAGIVVDENGSPLSNVSVNLTGSETFSTVTDSEGRFRFAGMPTSGAYTVAVNKRHYTFATDSQTFTNPTANINAVFSGTLNRHSISGRITRTDSTAAPGVTVQLSESGIAPVITDSDGYYSFSEVPAGENYTVVPSLTDFVFTPANITFDDLASDRTANFLAVVTHVSISGSVNDENDNPLSDVNVSLTGSQSDSVLTDSEGRFRFMSLPVSGTYTVTVSKRHYTFGTSSKTFDQPPVNRTATFSGRLNRHSIRGRIIETNGTAVSGVSVQLAQSPGTPVTTDSNGYYSFAELPAGQSYTVVPASIGFVFTPLNANFDDLSTSQTANFVGRLRPELLTEGTSQLAVALDSISFVAQPFSIFSSFGLNPDGLTRVSVFARNVEPVDAPSQISVVAEDDEGHTYPLIIEYMGDVVGQSWLKQLNIKFSSNLPTGRCIQLRLTVAGATSNSARICIVADGSSSSQGQK